MLPPTTVGTPTAALQSGLVPRGSRVTIFQEIYWVFLVLGTLVGVVVVGYMLYNAYAYRERAAPDVDIDRPTLGEIPTGGGGGKKLFLSFAISAVIVISLITWTYFTLLYVEEGADVDQGPEVEQQELAQQEAIEILVIGRQFEWAFVYPNEYRTTGTMRVPANTKIRLVVTSEDTFHNFGIPEQRVKSDAIPGQRTQTWFIADETGTYSAHCYEVCGAGHSYMDAEVVVMEPDGYDQWYANTSTANQTSTESAARSTQPVAQP
jgi:cytochrome c oxidase subunit 2